MFTEYTFLDELSLDLMRFGFWWVWEVRWQRSCQFCHVTGLFLLNRVTFYILRWVCHILKYAPKFWLYRRATGSSVSKSLLLRNRENSLRGKIASFISTKQKHYKKQFYYTSILLYLIQPPSHATLYDLFPLEWLNHLPCVFDFPL